MHQAPTTFCYKCRFIGEETPFLRRFLLCHVLPDLAHRYAYVKHDESLARAVRRGVRVVGDVHRYGGLSYAVDDGHGFGTVIFSIDYGIICVYEEDRIERTQIVAPASLSIEVLCLLCTLSGAFLSIILLPRPDPNTQEKHHEWQENTRVGWQQPSAPGFCQDQNHAWRWCQRQRKGARATPLRPVGFHSHLFHDGTLGGSRRKQNCQIRL